MGRVGMKLPDSKLQTLAMLLLYRFRLARRGLAFVERETSRIEPRVLTRIDLAWAIGTGLASKNNLVGPTFHTLNVLLALEAGEPYRIARALCWEAAQMSIDGVSVRRRTGEMLDAAEALARRLDQPYIEGLLVMARGYRDFCFGLWPTGRRSSTTPSASSASDAPAPPGSSARRIPAPSGASPTRATGPRSAADAPGCSRSRMRKATCSRRSTSGPSCSPCRCSPTIGPRRPAS